MASSCRVTVRNGSSIISGNCDGDLSSVETKDSLQIKAQGCIIDIKCQPGRTSCVRTISCPGMESLIANHDWEKRYNFTFR